MGKVEDLGAVISQLYTTIETRRHSDEEVSYTASLLKKGPEKCAKKFGEEAVEAAIAGALQQHHELTEEAADTLYHLLVLLVSVGVSLDDVASVLKDRTKQSGHAEKASR